MVDLHFPHETKSIRWAKIIFFEDKPAIGIYWHSVGIGLGLWADSSDQPRGEDGYAGVEVAAGLQEKDSGHVGTFWNLLNETWFGWVFMLPS